MTQAEKEAVMRDCDGTELRPGDQVEFVNDCIDEVRGLIASVTDARLAEVELEGERGVVRCSDIRKVTEVR